MDVANRAALGHTHPPSVLFVAVSLSVLGLALGPLLLAWGRGRALPSAAIEGFTLGLVPAVVLLRLLPHVHEEVGPVSLALVAVGYVALWVVERRRHKVLGRVGEAVALPALVVHATADGATLGVVLGQNAAVQSGAILAAALLIHRLPEGLFVARAIVPESGWRRAIGWIAVLSVATIFGAVLGDRALSLAPHGVFHGVVAVGLGAVLRLATHTHERTPTTRAGIAAFIAALVAGLAINAAVPAAALPELHAEAAHDPRIVTVAGVVALVVILAFGLRRFAPRSWLSKLGTTKDPDCDHDHEHDHRESPVRVPPP